MPNFIERIFIAIGKGIAQGMCAAWRDECEQNQKPFSAKFMFILPADHADIPFEITLDTSNVTDSEGNPIKDFNAENVIVETNSTNPSLVEIIMDTDENPLTGIIRIGSPSGDEFDIASVEAIVTINGHAIAADGAQFFITTGAVDPSTIRAKINFEGITETENPQTETPTEETPNEDGDGTGESGNFVSPS